MSKIILLLVESLASLRRKNWLLSESRTRRRPQRLSPFSGVAGPVFGAPAAYPYSQEPFDALHGRGNNIDLAVEALDPVDRHLVDAQATLLSQQEQLGVEEPLSILNLQQQFLSYAALGRFEATLRVGEPDAEEQLDQEVVAARDQFALPMS